MFRKAAGVVGEVLITSGVMILLYVGYTLWFTNAIANQNADSLREEFYQQLQAAEASGVESDETTGDSITGSVQQATNQLDEETPLEKVAPFGLVYIPKLAGDVWAEPLVSGIYYRALASGIGHYPTTELPGETGNFAIAGHRATNGEPFAYFERLAPGDKVFIQTLNGWFEYELRLDKKIQENEVWVLDDVPTGTGFEPGSSIITLTTCDPRWNSYQRWAWWGELVATYSSDETPIEILEGS